MHNNYFTTVSQGDACAAVRMAATKLSEHADYLPLGMWLESLSGADLRELVNLAERHDPDVEDDVRFDILLLTQCLLLAEAEDVQGMSDEELDEAAQQLCTLLTMEVLHRRGFIYLDHSNVTFDADYADEPIVKSRLCV